MATPARKIVADGDIARIPLTQGYEAIIDAGDIPVVSGSLWYAIVRPSGDVYAATSYPGTYKTTYLHRVVSNAQPGELIDHIDRNPLNNRKANLRRATRAQNAVNSRTPTNNTSGLKGVTWHPKTGKWRAKIVFKKKPISLGLFYTKDEASAAYEKALIQLFGVERHHGVTETGSPAGRIV